MNRRGFFKMLGLGAAGIAVLPVLDKILPKATQTYIVGKKAMYGHSLECYGCGGPADIEYKKFFYCEPCYYKARRVESPGWVSYRFHMTASLPPNTNYRIRYIDAQNEAGAL